MKSFLSPCLFLASRGDSRIARLRGTSSQVGAWLYIMHSFVSPTSKTINRFLNCGAKRGAHGYLRHTTAYRRREKRQSRFYGCFRWFLFWGGNRNLIHRYENLQSERTRVSPSRIGPPSPQAGKARLATLAEKELSVFSRRYLRLRRVESILRSPKVSFTFPTSWGRGTDCGRK